MHLRPATAGWLALLLALPAAARAQGWAVDVAAGRAVHDPLSARIGTTVASLGLGYDGGNGARWLYLSAGVPLGGSGPTWGAGGAGGWLGVERGGLSLGAQLAAHLFGFGSAGENPAGGGAALEVLPTAALTRGPFRGELYAGLTAPADVLGDSTDARAFFDSGVRLGFSPRADLEVGAEARYLAGEGGSWPYAGAAARVAPAWGEAWAYAGAWLGGDLPEPAAALGAGASYRIDRRTEVAAEVRQEPVDPVYFNPARRTWTLQLRRRLGRLAAAEAPAPALLPEVAGGRVTFRLPRAEHAQPPAVLGDFNRWQPARMAAAGRFWTVTVRVAPGVHHYGFRGADGRFFVPPHLPAVDDGMGGTSAVLVVP
ncbi:MAG TPA: glycogen-binding domain-containing protein [Longimicrobiaceae bacterium]|nr:glycogen-binding domain-containing protein [Longimicrobiaceae bacterium]